MDRGWRRGRDGVTNVSPDLVDQARGNDGDIRAGIPLGASRETVCPDPDSAEWRQLDGTDVTREGGRWTMKSGQSGAVEGSGQRTVRERKTIIIRNRERRQDQTLLSNDLRTRIAARAYSFYERRGYEDGYDLEDWLEAERVILAE